jgi:Rrf2 family protein
MLALAAADPGDWTSAPRLATAMAMPERFLPRILRDLARADLIEARGGRNGGYRLARPAAGISLLDVIDAVEPPELAPRCVLRGVACGVDGRCQVHDAFALARESHRSALAAASLARLAGRR